MSPNISNRNFPDPSSNFQITMSGNDSTSSSRNTPRSHINLYPSLSLPTGINLSPPRQLPLTSPTMSSPISATSFSSSLPQISVSQNTMLPRIDEIGLKQDKSKHSNEFKSKIRDLLVTENLETQVSHNSNSILNDAVSVTTSVGSNPSLTQKRKNKKKVGVSSSNDQLLPKLEMPFREPETPANDEKSSVNSELFIKNGFINGGEKNRVVNVGVEGSILNGASINSRGKPFNNNTNTNGNTPRTKSRFLRGSDPASKQQHEIDLKKAIALVVCNNYSLRKAAGATKVSHETLRRRIRNLKLKNEIYKNDGNAENNKDNEDTCLDQNKVVNGISNSNLNERNSTSKKPTNDPSGITETTSTNSKEPSSNIGNKRKAGLSKRHDQNSSSAKNNKMNNNKFQKLENGTRIKNVKNKNENLNASIETKKEPLQSQSQPQYQYRYQYQYQQDIVKQSNSVTYSNSPQYNKYPNIMNTQNPSDNAPSLETINQYQKPEEQFPHITTEDTSRINNSKNTLNSTEKTTNDRSKSNLSFEETNNASNDSVKEKNVNLKANTKQLVKMRNGLDSFEKAIKRELLSRDVKLQDFILGEFSKVKSTVFNYVEHTNEALQTAHAMMLEEIQQYENKSRHKTNDNLISENNSGNKRNFVSANSTSSTRTNRDLSGIKSKDTGIVLSPTEIHGVQSPAQNIPGHVYSPITDDKTTSSEKCINTMPKIPPISKSFFSSQTNSSNSSSQTDENRISRINSINCLINSTNTTTTPPPSTTINTSPMERLSSNGNGGSSQFLPSSSSLSPPPLLPAINTLTSTSPNNGSVHNGQIHGHAQGRDPLPTTMPAPPASLSITSPNSSPGCMPSILTPSSINSSASSSTSSSSRSSISSNSSIGSLGSSYTSMSVNNGGMILGSPAMPATTMGTGMGIGIHLTSPATNATTSISSSLSSSSLSLLSAAAASNSNNSNNNNGNSTSNNCSNSTSPISIPGLLINDDVTSKYLSPQQMDPRKQQPQNQQQQKNQTRSATQVPIMVLLSDDS